MIKALVATGRRRRFAGPGGAILTLAAAAFAAWVIWSNVFTISDPLIVGILFVCGLFTLLFPTIGARPESPETPTPIDWALSALSFATGVFFFAAAEKIAGRITLLDEFTGAEFFFGSALLFLSIEATRRTAGMGLTLIVLAFMAYNLFGHALPPPFGHGLIDYSYLLDILVFTTDGVFGVPIQVVASYVFLFVLFGTALHMTGGGEFFFQLASALTGRRTGGPAKVAVISSGLYGTMSGSPTSDVVATGSITIPVMKRLGYSARFAGAVEVAASTGGGAMPPIMGSAAFILAEFTGIAYREIVIAAIIPALLYYLGVFAQVHLRAVRHDLRPDEAEIPPLRRTLLGGWMYLIPLLVVLAALLAGYSPVFVAAFGALAVVVAGMFARKSRLSPWGLIRTLAETTLRVLPVAGACAAAGLVIGGLSMTGLGMKAANLITSVGDAEPVITLLIAAAVTIILGLGMPTPSAYVLAAILVGPALAELGFPLLESHVFLLYFAMLSALTPPIAVAALAASAIAEEDAFAIAFDAVKLAAIGFALPFAFVWNPALLGQGDALSVALAAVGGAAAAGLMALAVEGAPARRASRPLRLALIPLAALAVAPIPWLAACGAGGAAAVALWLYRGETRAPAKAARRAAE